MFSATLEGCFRLVSYGENQPLMPKLKFIKKLKLKIKIIISFLKNN